MVSELPVTLEGIKWNVEKDKFIREMKRILWTGKVNRNRNGMKQNQDVKIHSICDDILVYAQRVTIPEIPQKKMQREFYVGHFCISRIKTLWSYVYYPKMDREIEDVKGCRRCVPVAKLPMIQSEPWPKVEVPWLWLHIDFDGPLNGSYYLVIVDSFCKWPQISKCKRPTSSTATNFIREVFVWFGVPDMIESENGKQFVFF